MRTMAGPRSPLSEALARVGDRWSLLVIDALMASPLRYSDLAKSVRGIAPNVLSERLRRLERAGVVVAVPYSQRPLRYYYRLTEDGQEHAGVIRLLATWGRGEEDHAGGLHHNACGTTLEARWYCPTCAVMVDEEDSSDLHRV